MNYAPYENYGSLKIEAKHLPFGADAWWTEDDDIGANFNGEVISIGTLAWNDELSDAENLAAASAIVDAYFDISDIAAQVNELIRNYKRRPHQPRTFTQFCEEMGFPERDFKWGADEAGDWTPYYCDDCDTFHKVATALEFVRENGKLEINSYTVDQDGNWDFDTGFTEGDGDEAWSRFHWDEIESDTGQHFIGWAQYHLWCARVGKDPLEDSMRDHTPIGHAKHALAYANYLKPYQSTEGETE